MTCEAFIEDMRSFNLILLLAMVVSCSEKQRLEVVKFDVLENIIETPTEKVEVINFWATWCKPCIAEISYFQKLHQNNSSVNVTLVSLDFADEFHQKVIPFVETKGITADIILLDNIDYNSWIDKVDPSWSGAIPATLVINHQTGKRKFVEKELQEGEIESIIKELTD